MTTLTIITGASRGLGKQLAIHCLKAGDPDGFYHFLAPQPGQSGTLLLRQAN